MWASECFVYARNAGTFDSVGRRNENEAYAAFGELRSIGIQPDIWFAGAIAPIIWFEAENVEFCDVPVECVTFARMPKVSLKSLSLEREGLAQQALDLLQPDQRQPDLKQWQTLVERLYRPQHRVEIAIVVNTCTK